jgi:hypothetical protein
MTRSFENSPVRLEIKGGSPSSLNLKDKQLLFDEAGPGLGFASIIPYIHREEEYVRAQKMSRTA